MVTQAGNPNPPELGEFFGRALAACDFDGDGRDDLAVGVPFEDLPGATDAGAVQIHSGSSVGLTAFSTQIVTQESGTVPGDSECADSFGAAVACGDFDGDGHADLAIGAPSEDEDGLAEVGAETVLYGAIFGDGLETQSTGLWSSTAP